MAKVEFYIDNVLGGVFVRNAGAGQLPEGIEPEIIKTVQPTCQSCLKCSGAKEIWDLNVTSLVLNRNDMLVRKADCALLGKIFVVDDK